MPEFIHLQSRQLTNLLKRGSYVKILKTLFIIINIKGETFLHDFLYRKLQIKGLFAG